MVHGKTFFFLKKFQCLLELGSIPIGRPGVLGQGSNSQRTPRIKVASCHFIPRKISKKNILRKSTQKRPQGLR